MSILSCKRVSIVSTSIDTSRALIYDRLSQAEYISHLKMYDHKITFLYQPREIIFRESFPVRVNLSLFPECSHTRIVVRIIPRTDLLIFLGVYVLCTISILGILLLYLFSNNLQNALTILIPIVLLIFSVALSSCGTRLSAKKVLNIVNGT